MRLGVAAALVDREVVAGDVEVDGDVISAVGVQPAGRAGTAVPGYLDIQINGFGDLDFLTADEDGYRHAGEVLLSYGVTAFQPTLVTSPLPQLLDAVQRVTKARGQVRPRILGVHVEGPFISPAFKGAHDERWIIDPDLDVAEQICTAGDVTTMTIAPERPGGEELLRWLVHHGVHVSVGHTDADAATAHRAYDGGARLVTHLHNAQRRFTARDPGIAGVAMTRRDVTVTLIPDLVHLARETVLLAWYAARGRVALITDAIAAAPRSTGEFTLGDRRIIVSADAARLPDGTLAGSVLSMDKAVRNLVSIGVPWPEAVRGATTVPARLLGREDLATLRPGTRADIAVLDGDLEVEQTVLGGEQVWAR